MTAPFKPNLSNSFHDQHSFGIYHTGVTRKKKKKQIHIQKYWDLVFSDGDGTATAPKPIIFKYIMEQEEAG